LERQANNKQTVYNKTKDNQMETTLHKTRQTTTIHNAFLELTILKKQEKDIKKKISNIQETIKAQFQLDNAETGKHIILDNQGDVAGSITISKIETKNAIVFDCVEHFTTVLKMVAHVLKLENIKPSKTSRRYTFK
jgi:hypothetical protein